MTANTVELDALAAGDDVATDLIATKHYQQVKLVDGTIDGTTPIASGGGVEAGALRVTVASDSTGVLTVDGTVTANPASGTIDTVTNLAQMGGAALNMGEGIIATGTQRVTLATDDDATAHLATIAAAVGGTHTDDEAFTATSDDGVPMFAAVGLANCGSGDAGVVGMDVARNLFVSPNGRVAHDAAASGQDPIVMGARATNSVEGLTQVANADASYVATDLNGATIIRNGTTLEELVSERVSNTNGTSTDMTGAFAAGGANIHAYITSVTIHNSHATTMGYVDLRNGAAGGVVWTLPAPATGGTTHNFDPPLKFAANTAVAYDVSAAITTVYISINGFFAQG